MGDYMLLALNQEQQLIMATDLADRNQLYFCPCCKEPVYLKKGEIMIPHFAHYKTCTQQMFSEGETPEHLNGKRALANWFEQLGGEVQLEAFLPKIKQRPDILVKFSKKQTPIAVEFQCSPISPEKLSDRSFGYLKADYFPLWIFGERYKKQKMFSPTMKAGMFEVNEISYCLFLINSQLLVYRDIKSSGYPKKVSFETYTCPIHNGKINFKRQHVWEKGKKQSSLQEIHQHLLRQSHYRNPAYRDFFQSLYLANENCLNLHSSIYQPLAKDWLLLENPFYWRYQIFKILQTNFKAIKFNTNEIIQCMPKRLLQTNQTPQLSDPIPHLLNEYLTRLADSKWIKPTGGSTWQG